MEKKVRERPGPRRPPAENRRPPATGRARPPGCALHVRSHAPAACALAPSLRRALKAPNRPHPQKKLAVSCEVCKGRTKLSCDVCAGACGWHDTVHGKARGARGLRARPPTGRGLPEGPQPACRVASRPTRTLSPVTPSPHAACPALSGLIWNRRRARHQVPPLPHGRRARTHALLRVRHVQRERRADMPQLPRRGHHVPSLRTRAATGISLVTSWAPTCWPGTALCFAELDLMVTQALHKRCGVKQEQAPSPRVS
jgi:hypothetical protein